MDITEASVRFNGVELPIINGGYKILMRQSDYINKIEKFMIKNDIAFDKFWSLCAQYVYTAFLTAFQVFTFVADLSQITVGRFEGEKIQVLKIVKKLQSLMYSETALNGLTFLHILPGNIEMVVCIDAVFVLNSDKSIEMGILAMIRNKISGTVNIIHYSSSKSRQMCKSVLTPELFSFIDGYNVGYTLSHTLQERLRSNTDLTMYTAS